MVCRTLSRLVFATFLTGNTEVSQPLLFPQRKLGIGLATLFDAPPEADVEGRGSSYEPDDAGLGSSSPGTTFFLFERSEIFLGNQLST